jgi:hypothetical protein
VQHPASHPVASHFQAIEAELHIVAPADAEARDLRVGAGRCPLPERNSMMMGGKREVDDATHREAREMIARRSGGYCPGDREDVR